MLATYNPETALKAARIAPGDRYATHEKEASTSTKLERHGHPSQRTSGASGCAKRTQGASEMPEMFIQAPWLPNPKVFQMPAATNGN
ncbi:MAG: hypothetical protein AAGG11_20745 [Pseudomonadota bacterium]